MLRLFRTFTRHETVTGPLQYIYILQPPVTSHVVLNFTLPDKATTMRIYTLTMLLNRRPPFMKPQHIRRYVSEYYYAWLNKYRLPSAVHRKARRVPGATHHHDNLIDPVAPGPTDGRGRFHWSPYLCRTGCSATLVSPEQTWRERQVPAARPERRRASAAATHHVF